MSDTERITVGETADGEPFTLPVVDVLTGRGFATGKSGAGKSNTVSVVIEELLEAGLPAMIVDTDGEYYGLKEEYELLHAGADEECDVQIQPEHAERMATLALEENVPIILDVSGYLDGDAADELIRETARHLFAKEKKLKKPFLLVLEEVHEYIPEGGGMDDTGRMLIKIGKRGRKHGLGVVGISQRPADVKKDFITQANWLVWHRLTWENDTKVVGRVLGDEYEDRVSELPNGRAFVQTDWTETDVHEVQFREKRTFDAGATPGLEDFERPDLKSVNDDLVADLEDISDEQAAKEERIAALERRLQEREARIENLEEELASAQDVSEAARQMAAALTGDVDVDRTALEERVMEKDEEINDLRSQLNDVEAERDRLRRRVEDLEDAAPEDTDLDSFAAYEDRIEELEAQLADRESRIEALEAERTALEEDLRSAESALREREAEIERLQEDLAAAERAAATGTPATSEDPTAGADSSAGSTPATDGTESDDGHSLALGTEDDGEILEDTGGRSSAEPSVATAPEDRDRSRTADATGDDGEILENEDPDGGVILDEGTDEREDGGDVRDDEGAAGPGDADQETVAAAVDTVEDEATDEGAEVLDEEPSSDATTRVGEDATLVDLVLADPVTERILMAYREARCNERHTWQIVSALATEPPLTVREIEPHTDAAEANVRSLLTELRRLSLAVRHDDGTYELDRSAIERLVENPTRVDGFDDPEYVKRLD